VLLVVRDWVACEATRERVEGVVGVVLVLVPVFHGGYYVVPHFRHYHHFHPHQLRRLPTIVRSPNWEGFEPTPTISEDSRDGVFEPHLSKGF